MPDPSLLIISPVRNEADHLEAVVRAVTMQTIPPDAWILVDDDSTDETPALLRAFEHRVPFMRVLSTPPGYTRDNGDRHAVAAAPRAFNWGLAAVSRDGFTHIGKLDGDVELPPDYFERLLLEFQRDPALGIAGGTLVEPSGSGWRPERVPSHHVRGALKLYTRECFEAIGGIEERLGWDGIDETYARMVGFKTRSFPGIVARHHRPCGSTGGRLRGHARFGEADYILRRDPLWALLKSFKVAASGPLGISGVAFLYGYVRAAVRSVPRVDDEAYRSFVRRDLRRRLLRLGDASRS